MQKLSERWTLRTPDGWPSLVGAHLKQEGWMLLLSMAFLLPWIRNPVTIGIECVMAGILVRMVVRHATHAPALAAQAEAANRKLLGESVEAPAVPEARLPWWRLRGTVRLSKSDAPGWLPIPLGQLVPLWIAWAGIVVAVGLTVPGAVQDWVPLLYLLGWIEIERRLKERVERRIGLAEATRLRGYDVFRTARGWPWAVLFVLQLAVDGAIAIGVTSSGWFRGHGIGAAFGFGLIFTFLSGDLASRWRRHHAA